MNSKKITIALATAALALAACGGDSDNGAAEGFIAVAEAQEIELDKDCVEKLAAGITDADAKLVVAFAADLDGGQPELTAAGDELAEQIFNECEKDS